MGTLRSSNLVIVIEMLSTTFLTLGNASVWTDGSSAHGIFPLHSHQLRKYQQSPSLSKSPHEPTGIFWALEVQKSEGAGGLEIGVRGVRDFVMAWTPWKVPARTR